MKKSYPRDSLHPNKSSKPSKTVQQKKTSFRCSSYWQKYRNFRKRKDNYEDYVTQDPLKKGWSLHHMDLNEDNYQNLSEYSNFICCNKETHQMIHWLWKFYKKDPSIIDRLEEVMERMEDINSNLEDSIKDIRISSIIDEFDE